MNGITWLANSGVVQGVIIGSTFAYLTTVLLLNAVARGRMTSVNGWRAFREAGRPGSGLLVRAASQKVLPAVNVFEEAAYWSATRDASSAPLRGRHMYRVHFPADGLPANGAFWSITATDPAGYLVHTSAGHSSVSSSAGLVTNLDGSVDILMQRDIPSGAVLNRLATPPGRFKLLLRVYLPDPTIVSGGYAPPPIVRTSS